MRPEGRGRTVFLVPVIVRDLPPMSWSQPSLCRYRTSHSERVGRYQSSAKRANRRPGSSIADVSDRTHRSIQSLCIGAYRAYAQDHPGPLPRSIQRTSRGKPRCWLLQSPRIGSYRAYA
eukprot:1510988-Rhodomonas_salina.2